MSRYFCGWYFKCQSGEKTLALIPAYHKSKGERTCWLQIITDNEAFNITFPYERFMRNGWGLDIGIGDSRFSENGIELKVDTPDISACGCVRFGDLTPLRYDIMGPFRYLPFMQCRHSVVSMAHSVNGVLSINGERYVFNNSVGYIEGDRGRSFPRRYLWTQCGFESGSLMLSVADIPVGLFSFTGVIGAVFLDGKEYRLATYLGARVKKLSGGEVVVAQGDMRLRARLVERNEHLLRAPSVGAMSRTIRESASCRAEYTLVKDGKVMLDFESAKASFEYEYER